MARELRATLLGLAGGSGGDYDGTQAVLEQLSSSVLDGPQLQRSTYGPRVAQTARLLGLELMPWQQFVADVPSTRQSPAPSNGPWRTPGRGTGAAPMAA